jgi:DNA-binding NtrC family response regulator
LVASSPAVVECLSRDGWPLGISFEPLGGPEDLPPVPRLDCLCIQLTAKPSPDAMVRDLRRVAPGLPIVLLQVDSARPPHMATLAELPVVSLRDLDDLFRTFVRIEKQAEQSTDCPRLIGSSEPMRDLRREIALVRQSDIAVALWGETGTGKELVARSIHESGPRAKEPFVALNCASIPETLQESELFGHERGAFTGATSSRCGAFEQAHRGTLFLDEVGDMSLPTQASLLRVLQERSVRRVGAINEIPVDVRMISATSRELEAEVRARRFRADLCYRLVVYPIRLPPLRERLDDVPLLVDHFLHRRSRAEGRRVRSFHPDAIALLQKHDWPGNVRELENVVSRCALVCQGEEVGVLHLPPELRKGRRGLLVSVPASPAKAEAPAEPSTVLPLREVERRAILHALSAAGGSVPEAAKLLQIGRATLYRRVAELNGAEALEPEKTAADGATDGESRARNRPAG